MSKLTDLLKYNGVLERTNGPPLGPHTERKFSAMSFSDRQNAYLPMLAYAFGGKDLPPNLGVAIARVESTFKADAVNLAGGDGSRGGAYGLCQITLKTALYFDAKTTPKELLDPEYNAHMAAQICAEDAQRLGPGYSMQDLVSMYNSGKSLAHAPLSTYAVYVPKVMVFMARYKWTCRQYVSAI